jgi:hypothetical protein
MPASMSTTLKKTDSMSPVNRAFAEEYFEFLRAKDHKSDRNIVNQLTLLVSLDKFYEGLPFTSINSKEQVLKFLKHRYQDDKWIEREYDSEGRYITSWNFNLTMVKIFFRWLANRGIAYEEWETPSFVRIKLTKPLRDSPYSITEMELDERLYLVNPS